MGTTASDTLYLGLAHAAPPPVSPRQLFFVDARWQEWLPWATMEARKHSDPANWLHIFRTRHRTRLAALLNANIPWDTIRKHRLDSPTMDDAAFQFQLRAASERRRVRMGRVKGVKRGRGV